MLDFLAGVPGKLKTLIDRLTSTRAANLDNLDAAVSTRAVASTALSNATWTNGRAAALDLVFAEPETVKVPIASGLVFNGHTGGFLQEPNDAVLNSTASTSYVDAVNYTGAGVLEGLHHYGQSGTATVDLIIDGVTVWSGSAGGSGGIAHVVGSSHFDITNSKSIARCDGQIPFTTSLQIRHKAGTATASKVWTRYRKTG